MEGYSWVAAMNIPKIPSPVTPSGVWGWTPLVKTRQKTLSSETSRVFKHLKNPVRKAGISPVPHGATVDERPFDGGESHEA